MARCRACGAKIEFRETKNGNVQPIDLATGESHFAVCPEAKRFRKPAPAPDTQCHRCGSKNVQRQPGTALHDAGLRCLDGGQHRWLRRPEGAA